MGKKKRTPTSSAKLQSRASAPSRGHQKQPPVPRRRPTLWEDRGFARATLDALSAHIAVVNAQGVIEAVNRAWTDFAASNGPLRKNVCEGANYLSVCDAAAGEDAAIATEFAAGLRDVLLGHRDAFEIEYPCHSPDQERWFIARVTRFQHGEPVRAIIAHENITPRKKAESQLKASELKYRRLHDSIIDGIASVTMDGRVTEFNEAFRRMTGYESAELVLLTYRDITPEKWHAMETAVVTSQVLVRGYSEVYQKEYRRKDGTIFPVELRTVLLRDDAGKSVGMWAVVHDITARKQAEETLRSQQAAMAQMMRAVTAGEMTYGLAHELNQPLAALLLYAETCRDLLKSGSVPGRELAGPIDRLVAQVERARDIVARLRKFARRQPLVHSTVDVNQLIEDSLNLLVHELNQAGVAVQLEFAPEQPHVIADSVLLEQVVVNLVLNSLDAMTDKPQRSCLLYFGTEINPDGGCTVTVRDNGPGVPSEVIARLFEAYVTSKPDGLGLGLSICRSIIERHGGRIWHEAAAGGGAEFKFTLPPRAGAE